MGLYDLIALAGYVGIFVLYLFLLSHRLNLRIWVFAVLSLIITAAVCVVDFVLYPTVIGTVAVAVCALFDISAVIHLISGRKRVADVTNKTVSADKTLEDRL